MNAVSIECPWGEVVLTTPVTSSHSLSYGQLNSLYPTVDLRKLIDILPERDIPTTMRVLEALSISADPVVRSLALAPIDRRRARRMLASPGVLFASKNELPALVVTRPWL